MSYAEAIEQHYAGTWASPIARRRLTKGPIHELPRDFCVLVIPTTPGVLAYATRCMSQLDDDERLELHVLARSDDDDLADLVELMTVVAHYHRTGARLGHGHTVNFGRPWLPRSRCTRGLLSLPYLDGPSLEWMTTPRIRFLWLIPITPAELDLKKTWGLEALEQRFEETGFDYLDPRRASVA